MTRCLGETGGITAVTVCFALALCQCGGSQRMRACLREPSRAGCMRRSTLEQQRAPCILRCMLNFSVVVYAMCHTMRYVHMGWEVKGQRRWVALSASCTAVLQSVVQHRGDASPRVPLCRDAWCLQVGEDEEKLAENIGLMAVKTSRDSKRTILTDLITVSSRHCLVVRNRVVMIEYFLTSP